MTLREKLIAYSIKYEGDYRLIKKALLNQEEVQAVSCSVSIIVKGDRLYPKSLLLLDDPPFVLYALGNLRLLEKRSISVIGSRSALAYALEMTDFIIQQIPSDCVIVSGLAKGIDAQAHIAALKEHRKTIAVLGCGIDIVYPMSNLLLYEQIKRDGLILSEYPPHTQIRKHQFIARNRIIAALGESLVVMQAAQKSGTMSTVEFALNMGKEIYALPFHLNEAEGSGCNNLIQQGASLLTSEESLFKL